MGYEDKLLITYDTLIPKKVPDKNGPEGGTNFWYQGISAVSGIIGYQPLIRSANLSFPNDV
jgi:hypothetical protein